jgi:hypothetical protein
MKDRLVAVAWDDASVAQVDSFTREEIAERTPSRYITFGLLLRDDPKMVAIASEKGADNTYRVVTYIPRGMVMGITDLGTWPAKGRKVGTRKGSSPLDELPLSTTPAPAQAEAPAPLLAGHPTPDASLPIPG